MYTLIEASLNQLCAVHAHLLADCKSYLKNSLFIVGEFGGNDYNAGIFGRRSLDEVKTYVGQITDKVRSGVQVRTLHKSAAPTTKHSS